MNSLTEQYSGPTLGGIIGATASQKIGSYENFAGVEGCKGL